MEALDRRLSLTVHGYIRFNLLENAEFAYEGMLSEVIIQYLRDFIQYLIDLLFGTDEEWMEQQKQINNWIIKENVDLKQMKKIAFTMEMWKITVISRAKLGILYKSLKGDGSNTLIGEELSEAIIDGVATFRTLKIEKNNGAMYQIKYNQR